MICCKHFSLSLFLQKSFFVLSFTFIYFFFIFAFLNPALYHSLLSVVFSKRLFRVLWHTVQKLQSIIRVCVWSVWDRAHWACAASFQPCRGKRCVLSVVFFQSWCRLILLIQIIQIKEIRGVLQYIYNMWELQFSTSYETNTFTFFPVKKFCGIRHTDRNLNVFYRGEKPQSTISRRFLIVFLQHVS